MNDVLITRAGLSRAYEELKELKTAGRREIAERIRNALLTETNAGESAGSHAEAR